ncbi:MAG: penicillin-binding transpeptidase domain-containing protein [Acidimicrobiales bacterium]
MAAERITVRKYPYGKLLAHVLGYVGAVNEEELVEFQSDAKPYERDDEVGKTGIERALEARLRGVPGVVRYEVDARNRPIRKVPGGRQPVPGDDVYLSVDINLQYLAEKSLAAQIEAVIQGPCQPEGCPKPNSGSVVVIEPATGQVLAMASYPTYDPAGFVGGISTEEYEALTAESASVPAQNKAIAGQYAPGSTWKLFSAHAGLVNGQVRPEDRVNDPGYYLIPGCGSGDCEKQNANREPHGAVDLPSAISVSSDVYFYKLGDDMWRRRTTIGEDALGRTYQQWGFGTGTGVDLLGETDGRVPTPAWKRDAAKKAYPDDTAKAADYGSWFAGTNMNTAVGQGDVLVTPLQLANGYATFANGGTLFVPQFVLQVTKGYDDTVLDTFAPRDVGKVDLRPEWRLPMLAGFTGVTVNGTAAATFQGFPQDRFAVAGKTGTAQVDDKFDTALFAAFAPAAAPRFAAVAVIPEAGFGGDVAAPLIRRILEPIAVGDGTLASLPEAPLGGAFDVAAVLAETVAPASGTGD